MSSTNMWIVPDCDTVLDWLTASSIAVVRQLRSIGCRRCWTCSAWHRSLCLLIEVGERWRRRRADSRPPGNQMPDQSGTGRRRRRSWSQHIIRTGSQWSCCSIGVIWPRRGAPFISRVCGSVLYRLQASHQPVRQAVQYCIAIVQAARYKWLD